MANGSPRVPEHLYADRPRSRVGDDAIAALQRLSEGVRDADERALRVLGLRSLDAVALLHVVQGAREGRLLSPSELARVLRVSAPTVTKVVDRLTATGRVQRRRKEGDRRGMVLVPDGDAARELARAYGDVHAPLVAVIDGMSDADAAAVSRFALALAAALAAAEPPTGIDHPDATSNGVVDGAAAGDPDDAEPRASERADPARVGDHGDPHRPPLTIPVQGRVALGSGQ